MEKHPCFSIPWLEAGASSARTHGAWDAMSSKLWKLKVRRHRLGQPESNSPDIVFMCSKRQLSDSRNKICPQGRARGTHALGNLTILTTAPHLHATHQTPKIIPALTSTPSRESLLEGLAQLGLLVGGKRLESCC